MAERSRARSVGPAAHVVQIELLSADAARLSDFYRRLFDLRPARATKDGSYAEFDFGGMTLAIAAPLGAAPAARRKSGTTVRRTRPKPPSAVVVFSVPDFAAHLARAKRMRVSFESMRVDTPGDRSFSLRDPAGNLIELTERVG